jgi:hypothetical protein
MLQTVKLYTYTCCGDRVKSSTYRIGEPASGMNKLVSNSDYTVSNDKMISEQRTGNGVEGSGHGLV